MAHNLEEVEGGDGGKVELKFLHDNELHALDVA